MFREYYDRKLKGSHMIIEEEEDTDHPFPEFAVRMITENEIPGLLHCYVREVNEKKQLVYDITSMQRLSEVTQHREPDAALLRQIILGIVNGFAQCTEYFLNEESLLLDADYIYIDQLSKEIFLCFYPFQTKPLRELLTGFAQYLLRVTNHEDDEAVELVYAFYQNITRENYEFKALLIEQSKKHQRDICPVTEERQALQQKETEDEGELDLKTVASNQQENKSQNKSKKRLLSVMCLLLSILLIAIIYFNQGNYVAPCSLALGILLFLCYRIYNARKD